MAFFEKLALPFTTGKIPKSFMTLMKKMR